MTDEPAADDAEHPLLLGGALDPALAPAFAAERPLSVERLPTLTEVVELGRGPAPGIDEGAPTAQAQACAARSAVESAWPNAGRAEALVDQVLAELAPRIDALFEARLREALAPALARAADGLIRDTRAELAPALRALVAEAVARALERGDPS